MITSFKEHIKEKFSELERSKLLIACSGGIDSMVLSDLCLKAGLNISLAHCNFKLREQASDVDQEFVSTYATNNSILFHTINFDTSTYKIEKGLSTQLAARELRYEWFEKLLNETQSDYVLTAHHSDDSIETFFINLSRGSGIDGLTGIPAKRGIYRRPLLNYSRVSILNYAQEHKIQWREDASNKEEIYLRNHIRHQFMGEFSKLHPTAKDNLTKTIDFLSNTNDLLNAYIKQLKIQLFKEQTDEITAIDIKKLIKLNPLNETVYKLFVVYGFKDSQAIIDLTSSSSGKQLFSSTHHLLKNRDQLLLKPINTPSNKEEYTIEGLEQITTPICLTFKTVIQLEELETNTIYVDYNKLNFPLKLRKKTEGDMFYPFGMKGTKKLSKYFKDEKFDQFSKANQWLLCDAQDHIIWVVGRRFDNRFSINKLSDKILKISYKYH